MRPPLGPAHDRLLQAAVLGPEVHEDFTTSGPPVFVEMVWLASRDRVEVRAYDANKGPGELPFYSEDAERVVDAAFLWAKAVGSAPRWERPS
ncbi:hypothetical protein GBA65_15125 [Rubrobacter marinus]|uniref:Uncharacterized protein n=1 Tax=Rubrobacter marinus TaxID=2653852 RepID=A0A6G8PZK5_9ACTN|nr:hypothetical protein [Rubrobacter marinus]QIN79636.1 hypothetical protein GBA65_15125 [Rubrobacter marinus]